METFLPHRPLAEQSHEDMGDIQRALRLELGRAFDRLSPRKVRWNALSKFLMSRICGPLNEESKDEVIRDVRDRVHPGETCPVTATGLATISAPQARNRLVVVSLVSGVLADQRREVDTAVFESCGEGPKRSGESKHWAAIGYLGDEAEAVGTTFVRPVTLAFDGLKLLLESP